MKDKTGYNRQTFLHWVSGARGAGSSSSGGVTGILSPGRTKSGGVGGRWPGGVIGSLSGVLDRSLFGGGGATSSPGRLSQGRLSHQLGSLGGGKIQSDLSSAKNIIQFLDSVWNKADQLVKSIQVRHSQKSSSNCKGGDSAAAIGQ